MTSAATLSRSPPGTAWVTRGGTACARRRAGPCVVRASAAAGGKEGGDDADEADEGKRRGVIMGIDIRGIARRRRDDQTHKKLDDGPLESFLSHATEMGTTVPSRLLLEMTEQVEIEMKEVPWPTHHMPGHTRVSPLRLRAGC